jgi:hypothetical protein
MRLHLRSSLHPSLLPLIASAAAAIALLALARPASAESPEDERTSRQSFWQAQVGVRSTFVSDPGFDPFASDNALTSFSVAASRTVFEQGAYSLAPGIFWDYGSRSASARGDQTSLSAHRLGLALEGRCHLAPWVYGLLRVTPSAIQQSARLNDPFATAPYVANAWTFGVDASAGAAFLLGPHTSSPALARWWLAAEGGYSYAGSASLLMHADFPSDYPRRTGDVNLGTVALGGPFVRVSGSVTF